jgi:AraC-like DNA-binding protein
MNDTRASARPGRPQAPGPDRLSCAPDESRIGSLLALPLVLEELGVSPRQVLQRAGVRRSLFADPDNRISHEDICRLLALSAELTGRSDFGLLVGMRFKLTDLGQLGELMRHSTTVGVALRMLIAHLHFYDRAATPVLLRMEPAKLFLGYSLRHPATAGNGQLQDAALAVAHRMLRELCGPAWRPLQVHLSRRRPDRITPYQRYYGARVRFDAECSGLFFAAAWLEHAIADADPARWRLLYHAQQRAATNAGISFVEEVECVLHGLLVGGTTSAASVAQLFGCSERTLRMKLRAESTSLQRLLADIRFELARHLLQDTELPMSRIAAALCYADTAVFSRAFHGWAGVSPRQWRASKPRYSSPEISLAGVPAGDSRESTPRWQ